MSSDSATPDRIVKFGVMTSARPVETPKGKVAITPVFPHPTGLQDHRLIRGFEVNPHCAVGALLWLADLGIRFNIRGQGLKHMVLLVGGLLGAPVLEAEGLKIRPAIEAIAASRAAHRLELAGGIPTSKRVLRDANILGGLGEG